jgi:hypothetical protein
MPSVDWVETRHGEYGAPARFVAYKRNDFPEHLKQCGSETRTIWLLQQKETSR